MKIIFYILFFLIITPILYGFQFAHINKQPDYISKVDKVQSGVLDTITDFKKRSTGFILYDFREQNGNLSPLTGTNGYYQFLGSKYNITGVKLVGVLAAFGKKTGLGAKDTFSLLISAGNDSTGLPVNPIIGNVFFSIDNIDTNSIEPIYTYFNIPEPIDLTGKFTIMVEVWSKENDADTLTVYSNLQGDSKGEKTSFFSLQQDQGLVSYDFDNFNYLMPDGKRPDFDLMMFPVVEHKGVEVENPELTNDEFGIKYLDIVNGEELTINFSSESETNLEIFIADINGRIVKDLEMVYLYSGENIFKLDIAELEQGNYFCIFYSDKTKVSSKFQIIR